MDENRFIDALEKLKERLDPSKCPFDGDEADADAVYSAVMYALRSAIDETISILLGK